MNRWPNKYARFLSLCLIAIFSLTILLTAGQPALAVTEDIDRTQFRPVLGLEARTTGNAIPGGEFYLTLVIRNFSSHPALDATFELKTQHDKQQGADVLDPFQYLDPTDRELTIDRIEGNDTVTVTIPLKVKDDALQRDDYRLQVALKSKDVFFEESTVRSTANLTIPVTYGNLKPQVVVKQVTFEPAEPNLDESFIAKLYLENISQVDVRNLQVEFAGGDNFQVTELNSRKYINRLSAGNTNTVQFAIKAKEDRPGNQVNITLNYDYLGNQTNKQEEVINLPLPQPGTGSSGSTNNPLVRVSSFTITDTVPEQSAVLTLNVKNSGLEEARDVRLTIDGGSHIYPLNVSNVRYLTNLAPGAVQEVVIPLGLNTKSDVHVYPVDISFSYTDEDGKAATSEETLSISGEVLGVNRTKTDSTGVPRVIISKYTLSHDNILAGNTVTLRLYIENTSVQDVQNVKMSLVVPPVDGDSGGTVFSPVNSSNSFFLDTITGKETVVHTVDLFVDPSSAAKTYVVPVEIDYEDKDGKTIPTVKDTINIPVTQESRLQVLGVELPPMAFMGQPFPVVAEFVNVGKVPLNNFMVSIEGDFQTENATYFLGQFQIGASDYFQGFVIPQAPGSLTGQLVFTYLDNNNQQARVEKPFEIRVEEMSQDMMGPPPEDFFRPEPGMQPKSLVERVKDLAPYLTTGFLALVAAAIYWRKRRQKKDEELFHD